MKDLMKFLWLIASLFSFVVSNAQTDSLNWVREIDEQIWRPFSNSISSGNTDLLKSLHSKRIMRVGIDRGYIMTYDMYFPNTEKSTSNSTEKIVRTFELRFDKRICDGNRAWESGYYKGTSNRVGLRSITSYYGRFYVILERENGIWKIVVDADTSKNVSPEDFLKARPIE